MDIRITRSRNRKRTVSVRQTDGVLEVRAPAHLSDEDLKPIVERLHARILKRERRNLLHDGHLEEIAERLNARYFGDRLRWNSMSWSTNQNKRFGSCCTATRTIRVSDRVAAMPRFVREYVVMHELAHLIEANHGPGFWKLVNSYPRTERARGYLMAVGLEQPDMED